MTLLAVLLGLVFAYSLASGRLERTVFTAPIVFTAAGMCVLLVLPELRERHGSFEVLLGIAEAGLVLLLFTDASRTDLRVFRLTVMATVLMSIFAHGLSAMPGIEIYSAKAAALGPGAPEFDAAAQ
jgi:NhaP-type Na+/H+ or K+/H+ antiporter